MVLMKIDVTVKRNKAFQKKTCKYYNYGKIGYVAKFCQGNKQANATQFKRTKNKKNRIC